jgi:hypothetical protein
MARQPALDRRRLVRGVVVENNVDVEGSGHLVVDANQELAELDRSVPVVELPDDPTRRQVQRGEERGGPVPRVVVSPPFGLAGTQRQQRLVPPENSILPKVLRFLARPLHPPHDGFGPARARAGRGVQRASGGARSPGAGGLGPRLARRRCFGACRRAVNATGERAPGHAVGTQPPALHTGCNHARQQMPPLGALGRANPRRPHARPADLILRTDNRDSAFKLRHGTTPEYGENGNSRSATRAGGRR